MTHKTFVASEDGYVLNRCEEGDPPHAKVTFEVIGPDGYHQGNLTEGAAHELLKDLANPGGNNPAPPPPLRPKPRF
jgi:hypothetical protein